MYFLPVLLLVIIRQTDTVSGRNILKVVKSLQSCKVCDNTQFNELQTQINLALESTRYEAMKLTHEIRYECSTHVDEASEKVEESEIDSDVVENMMLNHINLCELAASDKIDAIDTRFYDVEETVDQITAFYKNEVIRLFTSDNEIEFVAHKFSKLMDDFRTQFELTIRPALGELLEAVEYQKIILPLMVKKCVQEASDMLSILKYFQSEQLKLKSDIYGELERASIQKKKINDAIYEKFKVYVLDVMEHVKQLDHQNLQMMILQEFEKCVADVEDIMKSFSTKFENILFKAKAIHDDGIAKISKFGREMMTEKFRNEFTGTLDDIRDIYDSMVDNTRVEIKSIITPSLEDFLLEFSEQSPSISKKTKRCFYEKLNLI